MRSRQGESPGGIRVLPPQVAAQIAAGEVIIRPAAVVKELVENALDAGAKNIRVELADGGRKLIRVVDDGHGMGREDAALSLRRHATSKIREEPDLLRLTTLGFRGEALPSIAMVSRFSLATCPPGQEMGVQLMVVAGEVQATRPWAGPPGAQVEVAELFFNTPARRKFLKSPEAEQAAVVETMRQVALAFPEVHFTLATPSRALLSAPATMDLRQRLADLYDAELARRLLPVSAQDDGMTVAGLVSAPDDTLATSRLQVLLVNRRVVADRILGAALKAAYQGIIPRGRHPAAVLALTLPPGLVDVNVHPAKAEVRFQEAGRVFALLSQALRRALAPWQGQPPDYTVTLTPAPPAAAEGPPPGLLYAIPPAASPPLEPELFPDNLAGPLAPATGPRSFRFQDLAILGQLHQTYILAQAPEGLILIDQHAAHERILYERLKNQGGAMARQALLLPRVVEAPPAQVGWVMQHLDLLARLGLGLEPFGGASFLLTHAPAALADADLDAVVAEALAVLAPGKAAADPQAVQEQALQTMACKAAIKAGARLERQEMAALLRQLDDAPRASHCPHGRPLWRLIALEDLDHSFRRGR
jgi:DNA mismatch repair protein MutL